MDSNRLIDAQFDRAVEIVQGLPKTGPIQTGYEEKLALYSLYKQATVGNVKQSRPGMWDMLGRAKWDAWAKQKDLSPAEAKWSYVETLQKILRKYPDAPESRELGRELASYSGDPSNLVMSGSLARSSAQERASSSEGSEDEEDTPGYMPPYPLEPEQQRLRPDESSEDDETSDDEGELHRSGYQPQIGNTGRPLSAVSSQHRYRTPMGMSSGVTVSYSPTGSPAIPPPRSPPGSLPIPLGMMPVAQPLPRYSTPSAFSPPVPDRTATSSPSIPSSFPTTLSYPPHLSHSVQPYSFRQGGSAGGGPAPPRLAGAPQGPQPRPPLERAVESVQASLAALRERLEGLEIATFGSNPSLAPRLGGNGSNSGGVSGTGGSSTLGNGAGVLRWDPQHMGLWSLVLVPLTRAANQVRLVLIFLSSPPTVNSGRGGRGQASSNTRAIMRRIILDVTFVFTVMSVLRSLWRRTGVRRREVNRALKLVWIALMGRKERVMVDRGV